MRYFSLNQSGSIVSDSTNLMESEKWFKATELKLKLEKAFSIVVVEVWGRIVSGFPGLIWAPSVGSLHTSQIREQMGRATQQYHPHCPNASSSVQLDIHLSL